MVLHVSQAFNWGPNAAHWHMVWKRHKGDGLVFPSPLVREVCYLPSAWRYSPSPPSTPRSIPAPVEPVPPKAPSSPPMSTETSS